MAWLYLALAIIVEVAGTTCLKLSHGLTRLIPSILLFVFYIASFAMAALAIKVIDLSVAYAIWAGLGTAATATIGILWFKEPASALKLISIALIVIGVMGVNWSQGRG